jgi:hypothetical protein
MPLNIQDTDSPKCTKKQHTHLAGEDGIKVYSVFVFQLLQQQLRNFKNKNGNAIDPGSTCE